MSDYIYDMIQARRFLQALDPTTDKFCFQFFKKTKGQDIDKPCIIGKLDDLEKVMAQNQIGRYNITAVLNATSSASRGLKDVSAIRVAFLDYDSKLVGKEIDYAGAKKVVQPLDVEKLTESKFPPHLVVSSSPGNYHAYWFLQEELVTDTEASAVDYRNLQKAIAYTWGGDPGITGLNQCARIPGFWRFKDDDDADPSLVSIIWQSEVEVRYRAGLLLTGLRAEYAKANIKPKTRRAADDDDDENEEESHSDEGGTFVSDEMRSLAMEWLDKACEEMAGCTEGGRDNLFNKLCYTAGGYVASGSLEHAVVAERLGDAAQEAGLSADKIRDKVNRVIRQGTARPIVREGGIIKPNQPHKVAETFVKETYTTTANRGGIRTLHYWCGGVWSHEEGCYKELDGDAFGKVVSDWLKTKKVRTKDEEGGFKTNAYYPKEKDYTEIEKQTKKVCYLNKEIEEGTWLDGNVKIPHSRCVPFSDGLLDALNDKFLPPDPLFLHKYACPLYYSEIGGETPHWDKFLDSISSDHEGVVDTDMVMLLQEWMGYLLTPDTSRHKMLIVVGPPRAGKGTLEHVITKMLGNRAVGTFSAESLSESFGLEALVNKTVCIAPDYRNVGKQTLITSKLLGLSADDNMNVNEKFEKNRKVSLKTRVMLFSNDAPIFSDVSGAMAARSMFIQLQNSFVGREDLELKAKLAGEIEGIVSWSLQGLKRLIKNNRFTEPESSMHLTQESRQNDSSLFAFLADRMVFGEEFACSKEDAYFEYTKWSELNGFGHPKNKLAFIRELTTVLMDNIAHKKEFQIVSEQATVGARVKYLRGVGILSDQNKDKYNPQNPPSTEDRRNDRQGATPF